MTSLPAAALSELAGALLAQAAAPVAAPAGSLGYDLSAVLVFLLFGIAFVVVTVSAISRFLRPKALPSDEPSKRDTYECGEPTIGSSWVRFDIRFYTVALIFLIFDVEIAFLYPWAVVFRELRHAGFGLFVFLEVLLFIGILLAGFIYCWAKGDLDWVKSLSSQIAPRAGGARRGGTSAAAPEAGARERGEETVAAR